ncbi:tyrosine-type recombinase/integrase [Hyphomonas sp.]|uniref:tyrosine-type recombinase/integrase n=1 Tax=Hyphomonas sp. TaxID=87 RepID=UPI003F6F8553
MKSLEPQAKVYTVWCDDLKGFGVRVNPAGTMTYIAKYRVSGKQRMTTIGRTEKVKAEYARRRAQELLGSAVKGVDEVAMEKAERRASTIEDLAAKFIADYIPFHLKPSTQADYRRSIEKFIIPKLGREKAHLIDRPMIAAFHQGFASTPYQANRILGTLSVMLTQAEIWGMRPEGINPCLRVKRFKEKKRERFLSTSELGQLADALELEAVQAPSAAAAFRLLILTGCRLGEIQKLEWKDVDFDRLEIRIPEAKSKTGSRTVYLSDQGVAILESIDRRPDNPYVIQGRGTDSYLTDLQKPWRRVRQAAGLDDVRIHDLRHTFAANAASQGLSLPMIGKLLGHTQAQTTARYAHLAADPVRKANADVARAISQGMKRQKPS